MTWLHPKSFNYFVVLRILLPTLLQNIGNRLGFKKCRYFQHGETEAEIYAHDTPLSSNPNETTAYWIGHSTFYIHLPNGTKLLTDPIDGDICPFLYPRQTRPGCDVSDLPHIDLILISHDHYDHFNKNTLLKLVPRQPLLILPKGIGMQARKLGFKHIIEMALWERVEVNGVSITATAAHHWSMQKEVPCLGYLVNDTLYFAGDTARLLDETLKKLSKYPIQTIFLPAGPDEERHLQRLTHLCTADALLIHALLRPKKIILMHTNTFRLSPGFYNEAKESLERLQNHLQDSTSPLKWYEKQILDEIAPLLSKEEALSILQNALILPKIGSRLSLTHVTHTSP